MDRKLVWSGLAFVGGVALLLLGSPSAASAHVCMDFPLSRVGAECVPRSPQKVGPCPVPRGADANVFRPGQSITVRLRETIDHPSHYRIAFDPDGERFRDPEAVDDTENDYPYVLLDGIPDDEAAIQEVEITFPEVVTEDGTLQLIQVMHDKGGNGFGGASGGADDNDDIYYSCADIALRTETAEAGGQRGSRLPLPVIAVLLGLSLWGVGTNRAAEVNQL